jgi:pilus assembly protein CpaE
MDAAQHILLVVNPNLACLRDARQFLDIAQSLSYPREKILVLLNLTGHKTDVKLSEIEQVLQTKVFGMIPADEDAVLSSLNEGVPIMLKKASHPVSKAYMKVAKALAETVLPKPGAKGEEPLTTPTDALKKSSRLG